MSLTAEQALQINVVNWFRNEYPLLANDLIHIANERKCTPAQGATLKRMGVVKGVSDLFLAVPMGRKHGLWLELKCGKNKPTPEQIEFSAQRIQMGYCAEFANGMDEAKEKIMAYVRLQAEQDAIDRYLAGFSAV